MPQAQLYGGGRSGQLCQRSSGEASGGDLFEDVLPVLHENQAGARHRWHTQTARRHNIGAIESWQEGSSGCGPQVFAGIDLNAAPEIIELDLHPDANTVQVLPFLSLGHLVFDPLSLLC